MILINTSEALADLLPEVLHVHDPDTPCIGELPLAVRRCVRDLILRAFFHTLSDEYYFDKDWLTRIRRDRALSMLSDRTWVDVEVVDTDGTFILIIEE